MANHRDPAPTWLNEKYVETFLRSSANDPNLKVNSIQIEPGSAVGDNYACQVFRVKLDISSKTITGKHLSLIGKLKPDTTLLREMNIDMFDIEAKYFEILQPKFIEVLTKKKEAAVFFPKCYHVDNEKKIIFMEDLKQEQKLELQPRGKFLTLQQVELVVDALATAHGASLYVIQENPQLVNVFDKQIWCKDVSPAITKFIANGVRAFERHVHGYKITDEWKKRLLGIGKRLSDEGFKIYEKKENQLNVLLHGDIWLNNMMFRFNKEDAEKVILLDYQLVNHGCFANDLHYFLFSSAQSDVILQHIDHILSRYFRKLIEIVPDAAEISFERIKKEFDEKYYFGYLMMLLVRPIVAAEEPPDMELMMNGKEEADVGYKNPLYISDLEKLLPFFESLGVH